jgi:glycosyltransferase involved in cell wall biosynthesis
MIKREGLSLICATRDRQIELRRLLESLKAQTNSSFELILVDQNQKLSITDLISEFSPFISIVHLRQAESNNSKARNFGSTKADYTWLGFPDDDCWYPPDFVQNLLNQVRDEMDGVFINWTDPTSYPVKVRFQFEAGKMTINDAFTLASCICLFLKRSTFINSQGFNEKLGLGENTLIKAGEEQELTLRLLQANGYIHKIPNLVVHHLMIERQWDKAFENRIASQGACDFLFTNRFKGSWNAYGLLITWMAGIIYNLLRMRSKNRNWYWLKLRGALTAPDYR